MRQHQQTIFYAEYMQEDWLDKDQQRTVTWLATRLPTILLGGCVGLLVSLFLVMASAADFASLLQMGLLGGFVGNCLNLQIAAEPHGVRKNNFAGTQTHVRKALLLGLLVAASNGLALLDPNSGYHLSDWLCDGCILGLGSLLSGWVFQVLLDRTPKEWVSVPHKHLGLRSRLVIWMNTLSPLHIWQAALLLGVGWGLGVGLSQGLSMGLGDGLSNGLLSGLSVSAIVVLVCVILAGTIGPLRFAERIRWTWRGLLQPEHLRTSLTVAGVLFFLDGLSDGLGMGLWWGLNQGLSDGLSIGLSFWILLGLYQGMKQEHLEDEDRRQFNQGIRRSLRNGLLIGLISTLIISLTSALSEGLSSGVIFGLSGGRSGILSYWLYFGQSGVQSGVLSYWLITLMGVVGLSNALILLFPGMVVMWSLSGGLTVLRHYVIRWLLARHRTFPWRAQEFLDDAAARILLRRVGGGYSFIHRRLQDYFADAVVPPSEN